jgi:hypothetical protein
MSMQTKQATTGAVTVVRVWSGIGAFAFTAPRAHTGDSKIAIAVSAGYRFETTPNHRTDLSPATTRSGTTAWSPPV